MKKRLLAAFMVMSMTAMTVVGCGSDSSSEETSGSTSAESTSEETEDESADAGREVVIVTAGTGEPYSLLTDDGSWTGIDADVWAAIEERCKCQPLFYIVR